VGRLGRARVKVRATGKSRCINLSRPTQSPNLPLEPNDHYQRIAHAGEERSWNPFQVPNKTSPSDGSGEQSIAHNSSSNLCLQTNHPTLAYKLIIQPLPTNAESKSNTIDAELASPGVAFSEVHSLNKTYLKPSP
jgi:hypothetical protein